MLIWSGKKNLNSGKIREISGNIIPQNLWPSLPRSWSQYTHTENLCLGHNSTLASWILIIYLTIVSWPWLEIITPRSRSQLTHGKHFSQTITFHMDQDTSHNCCPWPRGCCCGGICPVMAGLVWAYNGHPWMFWFPQITNMSCHTFLSKLLKANMCPQTLLW